MEKLKLCPFCGNHVRVMEMIGNFHGIICDGCGAVVNFLDKITQERAISAWNIRVNEYDDLGISPDKARDILKGAILREALQQKATMTTNSTTKMDKPIGSISVVYPDKSGGLSDTIVSRDHGDRPYDQKDYEKAKSMGLDLDDWNDYVRFYDLGESYDD